MIAYKLVTHTNIPYLCCCALSVTMKQINIFVFLSLVTYDLKRSLFSFMLTVKPWFMCLCIYYTPL